MINVGNACILIAIPVSVCELNLIQNNRDDIALTIKAGQL
jgi:hypothetical protein